MFPVDLTCTFYIHVQEYDESNEVIIDANYKVPKTAVVLAPTAQVVVPSSSIHKPPAPKPKGKKRGRPKGAKNHTGVGGDPRQRMVSFADDDDIDDFGGGGRRGSSHGDGQDSSANATRKQSAKFLVNILNSMIDKTFGNSKKSKSTAVQKGQKQVPIDMKSWDALSKMAPDAVSVACDYADIYSSLSMMNGQFVPKQEVLKDSSSVEMQLRIASLFAAAKGLCSISDGMSLQDRTDWDVIDDSGFHPIQSYMAAMQEQQRASVASHGHEEVVPGTSILTGQDSLAPSTGGHQPM